MLEFILICISALWLGILTSISPCPLATNIAAISFLSKKVLHVQAVLLAGLAYTAGRMLVYALIGFLIVQSLLSIPVLAQFLQFHMGKILGPVLLVAGVLLLNVIPLNIPGLSVSSKQQNTLASSGARGAFGLGLLFALSFCPVSAALFFGSLIPLAVQSKAGMVLPFIYGLGTGLPVLAFSVAIALGVKSLNIWFQRLSRLELYTRYLTGFVFIIVGLYYIWMHFVNTF
jgi:cytochrome c-type biogenesis protein